MKLKEIEALVSDGESEQIELKKTTGQRTAGAETACAMLNGQGGFVFFGVRSGGRIEGQQVADHTLQQVVAELGKIEPQIVIQPEEVPVKGERRIIALSVPAGERGPYTYDGRPYVRQGPTTQQMTQEEYRRRLLRQVDPSQRWEARPADGFGLDDLDHTEITRTVEEAIRRGRMDDPGTRDPKELLLGLGLLEDDQLLNAAVVLFGQANQLLPGFPQCLLRMARFRGTTKTEFEDNRQEHGHAFELLERAQRFMRDHLPVAGRIVPNLFERKDDPLYPPEALREAVANALCHRNYGTGGGSVGIAIFDDRLEISSTGTLPPDLTPEALRRSHASQPRNKLIANVFYRRGIIEQWGRGTIKIAELTEQAGLISPEFEERSGEVVVRFLPTRYIAPSRIEHDLTHLQRRVLQTVARSGPAMLSEIVESLSVGAGESPKRRAVQDNLQTLRSLELVELKGRGRGARWMLAENGT